LRNKLLIVFIQVNYLKKSAVLISCICVLSFVNPVFVLLKNVKYFPRGQKGLNLFCKNSFLFLNHRGVVMDEHSF